MTSKTVLGAGAILALVVSVPACATFHVDDASRLACRGRKVMEVGAGLAVPMQGFGHDMTLGSAVHILLPPGWTAHVKPSVVGTKLSWKEGESWTQAITAGTDSTVCYVIDWNTRMFYAGRNVKAIERQVAAQDPSGMAVKAPRGVAVPTPANATPRAVSVKTSPPPANSTPHAASASAPSPPAKSWSLPMGSLRTAIANWSTRAGYSLTWVAPDYRITTPQPPLRGGFKSAVEQALSLASAETEFDYRAQFDARAGALTVSLTRNPKQPLGRQWSLVPGGLKRQIELWATLAHYQVVWQAKTDFKVMASATLTGTFPDAVEKVVNGLHDAGSSITVSIYEGNHTIVVGG